MGIHVDFVDFSDLDKLSDQWDEHTKLLWVESPTNPTLKVVFAPIYFLQDLSQEHSL